MTLEQVLISLGVDMTSVDKGMRSVEHRFAKTLGAIRESFSSGFKNLFAPLSGVGLVMTLEKALDTAKRIKTEALAKGVSTDFLQDIENVGKAAGLAGEQVEMMFNRFEKGLPAGSDIEQSFYKMADNLAAIKDPATRAAEAVKLFGRSGVEMLRMLDGGSAGIKNMASQFDKLKESEIEALREAQHNIDRLSNKLTVGVGRIAYGANLYLRSWKFAGQGEGLGGNLGSARAEMEGEEMGERGNAMYAARRARRDARIAEAKDAADQYATLKMQQQAKVGSNPEKESAYEFLIKRAAGQVNDAPDVKAGLRALNEMYDLQGQYAKLKEDETHQQQTADQKHLEAVKEAQRISMKTKEADLQIAQTQALLARQANEAANARYGRFTPSIEQYAQYGRGAIGQGARYMLGLQNLAQRALLFGDTDTHKRAIDEYDKVHGQFSKAGLLTPDDHLENIAEETKKTSDHLQLLIEKRAAIVVVPADDDDGT